MIIITVTTTATTKIIVITTTTTATTITTIITTTTTTTIHLRKLYKYRLANEIMNLLLIQIYFLNVFISGCSESTHRNISASSDS